MRELAAFFLASFLVISTVAVAVNRSPEATRVSVTSVVPAEVIEQKMIVDEAEIKCLATNAYFETRGESYAGKLAVMWAVKNRVTSSQFPSSYCRTIHQKTSSVLEDIRVTSCAFSWACDDRVGVNRAQYLELEQMAREFMEGKLGPDITSGATYFHNLTVRPSWARKLQRTVTIDNHVFYRTKEEQT